MYRYIITLYIFHKNYLLTQNVHNFDDLRTFIAKICRCDLRTFSAFFWTEQQNPQSCSVFGCRNVVPLLLWDEWKKGRHHLTWNITPKKTRSDHYKWKKWTQSFIFSMYAKCWSRKYMDVLRIICIQDVRDEISLQRLF